MRLYRSKKVRISNKHWGVASKKLCVVNCSQQHCRTVPFHTQCLTQIETVQRIAVRGLWRLMPKKLTSCLKHPKTSWTMLDHVGPRSGLSPREIRLKVPRRDMVAQRPNSPFRPHMSATCARSERWIQLETYENTQRHWHLPMRHLMTTQSFSGAIWFWFWHLYTNRPLSISVWFFLHVLRSEI